MRYADFTDAGPGKFVATIDGARAFVPGVLPSGLAIPAEIARTLGSAREAIGALRAGVANLPRPDLLIRAFRTREAVLSSRIEGTQTSLEEAFIDGAVGAPAGDDDRIEVANYDRALRYGIAALKAGRPLSKHMVRSLHKELLTGARGDRKNPGSFRKEAVWMGGLESRKDINKARFIPPPAVHVEPCLDGLMEYIHQQDKQDTPLVRIALTHYQFETIHPFSDGNGRIGRLLIVLQMVHEGLLDEPWLYVSPFLERERDMYMQSLYDVSAKGAFLAWIHLFLHAVLDSARDTLQRVHRLRELEAEYRERLARYRTRKPLTLMEGLFSYPVTTVAEAESLLHSGTKTARKCLNRLVECGVVEALKISWRGRRGRPPTLYFCRDIHGIVEP